MDKQQEENVKIYVRSVMRYGKFFNNYKQYFADNELKRKEGEKYYTKRILSVLREVDALSEQEKNLFYQLLKNAEDYYRVQENKKLRTLQFGYAKICQSNYLAIETVLMIKKNYMNQQNIFENV